MWYTVESSKSTIREALEMFYPHWLISYSNLGSDYVGLSIREAIEKLSSSNPGRRIGFDGTAGIESELERTHQL